MTVSAQTPSNRSTGNGVTTVFPYTFKIIAQADLQVLVDGVVKTLTTDYTVSGAGDDAGGNVTFVTAPASGTSVVRRRNMSLVRTVDYQNQGDLQASTLNPDQDAPVLMAQQLQEQINRSARGPAGEAWDELPAAADRVGKYLGFDSVTGERALLDGSGTATDSQLVTFLQAGTGAVARAAQDKMREIVSVKDFGAVGDGVTDDTAAIQASIDAVGAAGGGRVVFPRGEYLCSTTASSGGLTQCLTIKHDDIELHVEQGARVYTDENAYLIGHGGFFKPGGLSGWFIYNARDSGNYGGAPFTLYAIANASKYARSVTLTTPAQHSNFAVGDWVLIRTGETLTSGTKTPMGEYNKITAINTGTGALTFEHPLRNDYAVENYPAGHPSAGTPAPFGVVNLTRPTNVLQHNFKITGSGSLESTSASTTPLIHGNQCIGLVRDGPEFVSYDWAFSEGSTLSRVVNTRVRLLSTGSRPGYSQDACNHDWLFDTSTITSAGQAQLHLHEGCSGKIGGGVMMVSALPIAGENVVSMRARAHDIVIGDIKIIGFGADTSSPAVYADSTTDNITVGQAHIYGAVNSGAGAVVLDGSSNRVGTINTDTGVIVTPDDGSEIAGGLTRFYPAVLFNSAGGSPAYAALGDPNNSQYQAWFLDSASDEYLSAVVKLPDDWRRFKARVWFANPGAGAGNVVWGLQLRRKGDGDDLDAATDTNTAETIAAPAEDFLKRGPFTTELINTPAKTLQFLVFRQGSSGTDTLANDVAFIALEVYRTL